MNEAVCQECGQILEDWGEYHTFEICVIEQRKRLSIFNDMFRALKLAEVTLRQLEDYVNPDVFSTINKVLYPAKGE